VSSQIDISFEHIFPVEGKCWAGFEALVCLLAHRQPPSLADVEFRRVDGAGGDGGVEVYWLLKNGTKEGF